MGKILVTGGTGFVGRHVVSALLESGHTVHVVSRVGVPARRQLRVHETRDLFGADRDELSALLRGMDAVVHLAWAVDPADYLDSNENWECLAGSVRLALIARDLGVQHFVGIGTCLEYEQTESNRSLSTPVDPNTVYGAAKAALFFSLREIFRRSTTEFAWCRLFFMHGDGEPQSRLFPFIRSQITRGIFPRLQTPAAVRDYLEVSEAGRQIATVVDKQLSGVFNVCSGIGQSVFEIATGIADQMGRNDLAREARDSSLGRERESADRIVGVPSAVLQVFKAPAR